MDFKRSVETILSKPNDPETKQDFNSASIWYESQCSACDQPLSQPYLEYINIYHQITSLYTFTTSHKSKILTLLTIYDTESERKEVKELNTPKSLNYGTCIAQLPNGELFCYGKADSASGIALIIDRNYEIRILPSGKRCYWSSAIYFNNNIYCFGGKTENSLPIALSMKFDLIRKQWINLIPLPQADCQCQSAIFNGNILISGYSMKNLLCYSIEIESFSIIPYDFKEDINYIMISDEKLYMIECNSNGWIYEGEDEYNLKPISKVTLSRFYSQIFCSCNKREIYIAIEDYMYGSHYIIYYKFDLNQKSLNKFKQIKF